MSDTIRRAAERAVERDPSDKEAHERAARQAARGNGYLAWLEAECVGETVLCPGVAWNVYGTLQGVLVAPGGEVHYLMGPAWDCDHDIGRALEAVQVGTAEEPVLLAAAQVTYLARMELAVSTRQAP